MAELVAAEKFAAGYGRVPVVSGVTLSLSRGEGPVGLCGPNGGGKSTFLKSCLGMVRALGGTLAVLGGRPGESGRLRRAGYVPQSRPGGAFRMTAGELAATSLEAVRGPLRRLRAEDRAAIDAALDRCGVLDLKRRAANELSGGQYQRVLLARALASSPELLLLDEPSAHLDAASRARVIDVIRDLAAEGRTGLLVVSHDRELLGLCARFIHFEGGTAREVPSPLGGDDA